MTTTEPATTDLTDADLAAVAGCGTGHKDWIPVDAIAQGLNRSTAEVTPTGQLTMNCEAIPVKHETRD